MGRLLLICLGGAIGTGARYGTGILCRALLGTAFPFGTLAVNLLGSFLLGVIMRVGFGTDALTGDARLVLGTGVMGGFTTYSSFSYETVNYFDQGAWGIGALNMCVTFLGCTLMTFLGIIVAKRLGGV